MLESGDGKGRWIDNVRAADGTAMRRLQRLRPVLTAVMPRRPDSEIVRNGRVMAANQRRHHPCRICIKRCHCLNHPVSCGCESWRVLCPSAAGAAWSLASGRIVAAALPGLAWISTPDDSPSQFSILVRHYGALIASMHGVTSC